MKLSKNGFTLLELLIYTGLLAIISVVVINVFLGLSNSRGEVAARTEVNSGLRFAVEKINQDIRSASSITTPAGAGGSSSSLVMVIGSDTVITYCVSSDILRRQLNGSCDDSSPTVTGSKVSVTAINFTRFENTNLILSNTVVSIQTSITMAYISSNPNLNYSADQITVQSPL